MSKFGVLAQGLLEPPEAIEVLTFWNEFRAISWHLVSKTDYLFSRDKLIISQIFRDRVFILLNFINILFFTFWWYPTLLIGHLQSPSQDFLTLPMLRLLLSKAQGHNDFWKPSEPCHVGVHWIALAEYSQMSTHLPGFQSFQGFLHPFVLAR